MLLSAGPAAAQGLLPAVGPNVQLGDLRRQFERTYANQPAIGTRTWTITPSIDVEQTLTDNARGLGTTVRTGPEFLTTVTPGIAISGDAPRLKGGFAYSPQLRAYANSPRQNGVAQNLTGNARATIFEELMFLNVNAFMGEQSRAGGVGPAGAPGAGRQDTVQTSSYTAAPLLQHRFGSYGLAELGYSYGYQSQTGRGAALNTPFAPALSTKPTTTTSMHAAFTSGDEFGRLTFGAVARRTHFAGSGVLRNAHRNTEIVDVGYAVTRLITLVGEIGHENLRYEGTTPVRINGLVWSGGIRWNPDPDTRVTLRYGHRDGGNSVSFDGSMAPTARTRLTARYSEGISTGQEDLAAAIASADLDATGAPVDRQTGTPITLLDNFGGAQGGLARTKRASVTGTLLRDADTVNVTVSRDERKLLSANTLGGAQATSGLNASLSYQRELAPELRANAYLSYGNRTAGGGAGATQKTVTFSTGLTYIFSDTLTGRATYSYTSSTSNRAGFSYDMNLLTLGMHKSF